MSIQELQKGLEELSERFSSLSAEDQASKENARLSLSLGHQMRLEKAKAFEVIKESLSKISDPAERIKYLKDLVEKAGIEPLPKASSLTDLKTKMGEDRFNEYILGRAARDLLGANSHGYEEVKSFSVIAEATEKAGIEKKIISQLLKKCESANTIDDLTTYLDELRGIYGDEALPFIDSLASELTELGNSLSTEEARKIGEMTPFQRTGSDEAKLREEIHRGPITKFIETLKLKQKEKDTQLATASDEMSGKLSALTGVLSLEVEKIQKETEYLRAKSPQTLPHDFIGPLLPNQKRNSNSAPTTPPIPQEEEDKKDDPQKKPIPTSIPQAASFGFSIEQAGYRIEVKSVSAGSAAEKAGILPGDIIYRWEGNPVTSLRQFNQILEGTQVGLQYNFEVLRDRRPLAIQVKSDQGRDKIPGLGITFSRYTTSPWWSLGFRRDAHVGIFIEGVEPGSPASKLGLGHGDSIMQVNGQDIKNSRDFFKLWHQAFSKGEEFTLTLRDKGTVKITPSTGSYYGWADQNNERDSKL